MCLWNTNAPFGQFDLLNLTFDLERWPWHVTYQNVRLHEIHMHAKYQVSVTNGSKVMAKIKVCDKQTNKQIIKGDNSKIKKDRVTILARDTSSTYEKHFCEVISKSIHAWPSYRAEGKVTQSSKEKNQFWKRGDNSETGKDIVLVLARDTSCTYGKHLYEVISKSLYPRPSYRAEGNVINKSEKGR